jgi:hypothetical protein
MQCTFEERNVFRIYVRKPCIERTCGSCNFDGGTKADLQGCEQD